MSSLKELHLKSIDTMAKISQRAVAATTHPITPTTNVIVNPKPPSNGKTKSTPSPSASSSSSKKNVSVQHMSFMKSKTVQRVLFDILNLLQKEDKPLSKDDISLSTNHEINNDIEEKLSTNPKIKVIYAEGGEKLFSYKPTYEVKTKDELLQLVHTQPNGVPVSELKDSYRDVEKDIKKLADEKKIYLIKNSESKTEVLFPVESQYQITLLPEFVELWKEIKIPDEVDLEKTMQDAGLSMMEAPTKPVRKPPSREEKKKKRRLNLQKITNVHMLDTLDLSKDYEPQPKKNS